MFVRRDDSETFESFRVKFDANSQITVTEEGAREISGTSEAPFPPLEQDFVPLDYNFTVSKTAPKIQVLQSQSFSRLAVVAKTETPGFVFPNQSAKAFFEDEFFVYNPFSNLLPDEPIMYVLDVNQVVKPLAALIIKPIITNNRHIWLKVAGSVILPLVYNEDSFKTEITFSCGPNVKSTWLVGFRRCKLTITGFSKTPIPPFPPIDSGYVIV